MKTYVIQLHNDGGSITDNILIFRDFDNAKKEFLRQYEMYKKIAKSVAMPASPSDDGCEATGWFTTEDTDGTMTTAHLFDYHILDDDD